MTTAVFMDFSGRQITPLVLQTKATETSLACCLATVASFNGYRLDLASLRQKFSLQLHLNPRPVRVVLSPLTKLNLPAILHWGFKYFVLLNQVDHGAVRLYDPDRGSLNLPFTEVCKDFPGIALELMPDQSFAAKTESWHIKLNRLIDQLASTSSAALQIILLASAIEVFAIVAPFFMQLVVNNAR